MTDFDVPGARLASAQTNFNRCLRVSLARAHQPRFRELSARKLFANLDVRERQVIAGKILLRERDPCDALLFLNTGWAGKFVTTRDGKRHVPAMIVSGEPCNLSALLFEGADYGLQMLTAGTVLSVPLAAARDLQARVPQVAHAVSSLFLMENAILTQHTLRLGRLPARERLIHLLCELSYRTGLASGSSSRGSSGSTPMEIPITQEWLGDLLGLTTVHVNRTLQQLRHEGLLQSRSHRIVVPDVSLLHSISAFDPSYLLSPRVDAETLMA